MLARYLTTVVIACLGGCASLPPWLPLPSGPDSSPQPAEPAEFSFNWQLSGDKHVAPLQLFDDGQSTWLQFAEHQVIPAIFNSTQFGQTPVAYRKQDPYVVLAGVWPELIFRGGHLKAVARKVDADSSADDPLVTPLAPDRVPVALPVDSANLQPTAAAALPAQLLAPGVVPGTEPQPQAQLLPEPGFQSVTVFAVSAADQNLRKALQRWAALEGWTFSPEHWAVEVDIPIAASASFGSDFVGSVQSLVAATELSDHPLQPCFYANRVLRVVAYTLACDRTAGAVSQVAS